MDERRPPAESPPPDPEQAFARLRLVHDVDRGILAGRDPRPLITEALAELVIVMGADRASLTELDRVNRQMHVFAQSGPGGFRSPLVPLDRIVTDAWLAAPVAEVFPDLRHAGDRIRSADLLIANGTRSLARVPVLDQGRLWVLAVTTQQPRDWSATEMEILQEVASQLVIAIRQATTLAALGEQESRLRRILRQAANAMVVLDGTLRIEEVNPAAIRLLDRPPERLIGEAGDRYVALTGGASLAAAVRDALSDLSDRGPARVFEGEVRLYDRAVPVTIHCSRLSSGIRGTVLLELVPGVGGTEATPAS